MSIDDATPAEWDRLRQQAPAIEKKATWLDAWMRAAHDEASEAWEEDAGRVDWDSAARLSKKWPESKISPELLAKYTALADEEQNKVDFDKLHGDEEEENLEDVVNNPTHYNTGNIECIDAIKESMSSVAFKGYLKGNCMKYLWRYDYKGKQVQDLQKAGWYLNKLTAIVKQENG